MRVLWETSARSLIDFDSLCRNVRPIVLVGALSSRWNGKMVIRIGWSRRDDDFRGNLRLPLHNSSIIVIDTTRSGLIKLGLAVYYVSPQSKWSQVHVIHLLRSIIGVHCTVWSLSLSSSHKLLMNSTLALLLFNKLTWQSNNSKSTRIPSN